MNVQTFGHKYPSSLLYGSQSNVSIVEGQNLSDHISTQVVQSRDTIVQSTLEKCNIKLYEFDDQSVLELMLTVAETGGFSVPEEGTQRSLTETAAWRCPPLPRSSSVR